MKKRILLLFLSALLLSGCGLKADTKNTSPALEESENLEGHIAPIDNTLIVEACETLSLDPAEYLTIGEGVDPAKIELHFDSVNPTVCEKYPVSASYGDETVEFSIRIIDRTAPEITVNADIPIFSTYGGVRCKDLVTVQDLSEVTLQFESGWPTFFSNDPGEYELKVIAMDTYGNRNAAKVTVTIESPVLTLDSKIEEQIKNDPALEDAFKDYLLDGESALLGENIDFTDLEGYGYPFSSPLMAGDSAAIQDVCDMINKGDFFPYYLTDVEYALLDCGMDGRPELAVRYYYHYDEYTSIMLTTVLREENDTIVMTHKEQYYLENDRIRNQLTLYPDGCYVSKVFDGAKDYNYCYGVLDESGTPIGIYHHYFCSGPPVIYYIDEPYSALHSLLETEELSVDDWHYIDELTRPLELNVYFFGQDTYLTYSIREDASEEYKQTLSDYISLCEENGAVFYSDEEIEKRIRRQADTLGFSEYEFPHPKEDEVKWHTLLSSQFSTKD